MKQGELLAITEGVADFIRGHVGSAMEWTAKRLKALEERIEAIPAGKDGIDGRPGVDGEAGKPGLDGKDGRDGIDGRDAKVDPIEIAALVIRNIKEPKDGEPGAKGQDGAPGAPGEKGERGPAGEVGPKGDKGLDGQPGARGEKGEPGVAGKDFDIGLLPGIVKQLEDHISDKIAAIPHGPKGDVGKDGRDGKDFDIEKVRGVLEGEVAKWALDFERRAGDLMQRAIDRIPKPKDGADGRHGSDGKDGFEFIELDFDYDGERGLTVKASNGERVKAKTFKMPIPLYRGTYKSADVYEKSDTVTYGGSLWIAQQDNPGTPGDGPTWKLAVRKGVDGKGSK